MKTDISLSDQRYFKLSIGKRILKKQLFQSRGKVPVYSANVFKPFGFIERPNKSITNFEYDYILWGIDGNFEFNIMPKHETFAVTDHCGVVRILDNDIVPEYVAYQLELKRHEYGFDRTLRASLKNMRNVAISIPTNSNGTLDRGQQEMLVKKLKFIGETWNDITMGLAELQEATIEFEDELPSEGITLSQFTEVPLGDSRYFRLQRGRRVTRKDCVNHSGNIPIISGRGRKNSYLGYVSEDWLKERSIPVYDKPMIVIAANGSVGSVFLRDESKYTIHDDAIGVVVNDPQLSPEYVQYALRDAAVKAQFQYNAKLYQKTLRSLKIRIPMKGDGSIDRAKQNELAKRFMALDALKDKLSNLAEELEEKLLVAMN
jgi:hypothetical protein